ncbi:MAG: Glu/Leu/Phe/Val dehydrogenase dimerization domain-containing protein [bacterium]|nr:Glu/Leu/Phe/Val dehydrogenase dimerization domain-containing protein [bacterium]
MKNHCYIEPEISSNVFETLAVNNHEKLIFGYNKKAGLKVILAIHDTTLGPSTGGVRVAMVSEEKAIEEALRLSYAMTFKTAIIDEPFGGSKAVVIGDPTKPKTKKFLHALGDFIESLGGAFLTGVDMGLTLEDAKIIRERTKYIFNAKGCSGVTTGHGVLKGLKESVKYKLGKDSLKNVRVAIQGLGNVGGTLADLLLKEGAIIYVSDTDAKKTKKYSGVKNCHIVSNEKIYDVECDVFAPCATGEIINDETINRLKCSIVAGGANNQLHDEVKHATMLYNKGILHAPDFVINAAGVCHGMCEVKGVDVKEAMKKTDLIPIILRKVFERSDKNKIPPLFVAYQIAYEKIQAKKK